MLFIALIAPYDPQIVRYDRRNVRNDPRAHWDGTQRARGLVFRASAGGRHIWRRVPDVFSTWLNVWNCNSKYFKDHLKTSPKR